MAVNSELRRREREYPLLMEYNLIGEFYVVLMSAPGVGMVVKSNSPSHPVGEYRTDWRLEISGIRYFSPYPEEVVLRNAG